MNTSDEFLAYAKECMQWAAKAKTDEERKAFVELAQHWTQAALRSGMIPDKFDGPRLASQH
jgi:hypothetical protein